MRWMMIVQRIRASRTYRALATGLLLACLTTAASGAAAPPQDAVVRELQKISRALERLIQAVDADSERGNVALLLQRAELEVARIAPLETQLRSSRAQRDAQVTQESRAEAMIADLERRIFESDDDEERQTQLRREREEIILNMETIEAQTRTAEQRVIELEDDLARRSEVFESLKARVDELLGLE